MEVAPGTPEQLRQTVHQDILLHAELVKAAGFTAVAACSTGCRIRRDTAPGTTADNAPGSRARRGLLLATPSTSSQ
jgi:hypothetical protein